MGVVFPLFVGGVARLATGGADKAIKHKPIVIQIIGGVVGFEGDGDRFQGRRGGAAAHVVAFGPGGYGYRLGQGEVGQGEGSVFQSYCFIVG